ncbi:hypothetical protein PoB_006449900 [Plakobranchus ocellatus]|uniref:Uncharacterized protein n=1 Tax=Plakobranchus ocellatus TaxID=259542 RepID=A0AAV4D1F6_9GAST|nr:hypothetical protein PoB_006449900 [Plakobranchus ocellatus]
MVFSFSQFDEASCEGDGELAKRCVDTSTRFRTVEVINYGIVFTVNISTYFKIDKAQIVPPTGSMGDIQGMGQHDLWQKYLTYRLLYGDEAARIVMASQLATHLGNSPFAN